MSCNLSTNLNRTAVGLPRDPEHSTPNGGCRKYGPRLRAGVANGERGLFGPKPRLVERHPDGAVARAGCASGYGCGAGEGVAVGAFAQLGGGVEIGVIGVGEEGELCAR